MDKVVIEIKKNAKERGLPTLPFQFEEYYHVNEKYRFPFEEFVNRVDHLQEDNQVNYDVKIEGKFSFLKKIIRKLYEFHMRLLWAKQNQINTEYAWSIYEIKNYICNKEKGYNVEIVQLKKKLEEQNRQIIQLKKELEKLQ